MVNGGVIGLSEDINHYASALCACVCVGVISILTTVNAAFSSLQLALASTSISEERDLIVHLNGSGYLGERSNVSHHILCSCHGKSRGPHATSACPGRFLRMGSEGVQEVGGGRSISLTDI